MLADLLWACASLNLQPSSAFRKVFLTAAARAADAGSFSVQQLGTLVWSLAVVKPPSQALLMSQQLQVQVLLQAAATANNGQGLRLLGPGEFTNVVIGGVLVQGAQSQQQTGAGAVAGGSDSAASTEAVLAWARWA